MPFRAGLVDEWQTMVETNLLGVLYATHVFVDDLCSHPETRQEADAVYHGRSEILGAQDVASLIVHAATAPERVSVDEVLGRPLHQLN